MDVASAIEPGGMTFRPATGLCRFWEQEIVWGTLPGDENR